MNQKMLQACALGFLLLFSISTSAQPEDVKTWVKADQQAEQDVTKSPMFKLVPMGLGMGAVGLTAHQFEKADLLRRQARKSARSGNRDLATSLAKKADRAEAVAGVTVMLSVPAVIVSLQKSFAVKDKQSKYVEEMIARQHEKAMATQQVSGATPQTASADTANPVAD